MIPRRALLASLLLLAPLVRGGTSPPAAAELVWHDARTLTLEGRGWTDTAAPYDRLPARAEAVVRPEVWSLAHDAAGLLVRFTSDAPLLAARWSLTSADLAMPHMPASGVSGLDLYARTEAGWRWVGAGRPTGRDNTVTLVEGLDPGTREYQLYLPLYNGVTSLEIGVPEGASLSPAPRPDGSTRPLVFYGTSITQGGCASRPGLVHTALLGREFNRPVINLGFSGNGRMELALATLLGELDAEVFVLDCLPNLSDTQVAERTVPFVEELRKHRPTTPILLVEDRTFADAAFRPARRASHRARRAALRAAFDALRARGVPGLHYLEGEGLLGDDGEGTVDGSHPTDLGFARQAAVFRGALQRILGSAE